MVEVTETIEVDKPVEEVFAYWSDHSNCLGGARRSAVDKPHPGGKDGTRGDV